MTENFGSEFGLAPRSSAEQCDECKQIGNAVASHIRHSTDTDTKILIYSSFKKMLVSAASGCNSCRFLETQLENQSYTWSDRDRFFEFPVTLYLFSSNSDSGSFSRNAVLRVEAVVGPINLFAMVHICTPYGRYSC
jgi:hypothetical protein